MDYDSLLVVEVASLTLIALLKLSGCVCLYIYIYVCVCVCVCLCVCVSLCVVCKTYEMTLKPRIKRECVNMCE